MLRGSLIQLDATFDAVEGRERSDSDVTGKKAEANYESEISSTPDDSQPLTQPQAYHIIIQAIRPGLPRSVEGEDLLSEMFYLRV